VQTLAEILINSENYITVLDQSVPHRDELSGCWPVGKLLVGDSGDRHSVDPNMCEFGVVEDLVHFRGSARGVVQQLSRCIDQQFAKLLFVRHLP
jgi:hypothetical protein